MLKFDLQLFGGGKKAKVKTTAAQIPTASSEENQALSQEMSFLPGVMNTANNLINAANSQLNTATQINPDYSGLLSKALSGIGTAQDEVNNLYPQASNAVTDANNTNNGYINSLNNALSTYQEGNKYLDSDYQQAMANNQTAMNSIANGELPSSYAANRQKALQDDLTSTVGNTLSSLADRGIINSSVTNQALNDIEKNASNTFARNYMNDLNTASNLNTTAYNNQLNGLNGRAALNSGLFTNTSSGIGQQAGLTGSNFNNTLNGISTQSGLANQQANMAQAPISTASNTQSAANFSPLSYISAALNAQSPSLDLYQIMSGHRYQVATPAQTYVKQGSGGWFGNLLGSAANSAAAFYACFPAGTLVSTGYEDVPIEKMREGDTAVIQGGHMARVKKVHDMGEQMTYNVETVPSIDGTIRKVTTTLTEVFLTPEGRKPLSALKAGMKVWTVDSFCRLAHVTKNKAERVYELELDDDSALFYANGFAAEPLTAKDKAANGKADGKEEK